MLIRPLLRYLDVRRSNDSKDQRIRRNVGLGALVEYTVSEVLDRSRYLYGSYEYVYASAFVAQIAPGSTVAPNSVGHVRKHAHEREQRAVLIDHPDSTLLGRE